MKKLILFSLILISFTTLSGTAHALMYFAPAYKPGLIFVDKSNLLYKNGNFSTFSWANFQNTNAGPGAEPAGKRHTMLGAPDDLSVASDPDSSYILGKGGRVRLGFGGLFAADGTTNSLPTGKHWRSINKILKGIEVVIFQDDSFAGGIIYGKEPGVPRTKLVRFGDGILNGKGFSPYDVAILLDLDQMNAADGKTFNRLVLKDRGGSSPYFEVDAAGVVKVVPEPASMFLLGFGLIWLGGSKIRKRLKT